MVATACGKSGYFNNSATHYTTEKGSCKTGVDDSILFPADATKHNERFWRSGGLYLTILITDGYSPPLKISHFTVSFLWGYSSIEPAGSGIGPHVLPFQIT
jgi:hypothetical protein